MKVFLTICFCLLFCGMFAQQQDVQALLQKEEAVLYQLQEQRSQKVYDLQTQGIDPKSDFELIELDSQIKAQNAKVKALKKQAKRLKKAADKAERARQKELLAQQQQQQSAPQRPINNQPTPQTQTETTPSVNQPVKQPKTTKTKASPEAKAIQKQIKSLKRRKKELEKNAVTEGRNPQTAPEVVVVAEAIAQKESELASLLNIPTVSPAPQAITDPTPKEVPVFVTETPAKPSPATPANPTSQTEVQPLPQIGLSTILFKKFSTAIDPSYDLYLNYVAKQMLENPRLMINVSAFTDNSEKQRISMQLTAAMANSVRQALVARGINPQRIIVKPEGSRKALGDNKTLLGQSRNRRVELSFSAPAAGI